MVVDPAVVVSAAFWDMGKHSMHLHRQLNGPTSATQPDRLIPAVVDAVRGCEIEHRSGGGDELARGNSVTIHCYDAGAVNMQVMP